MQANSHALQNTSCLPAVKGIHMILSEKLPDVFIILNYDLTFERQESERERELIGMKLGAL